VILLFYVMISVAYPHALNVWNLAGIEKHAEFRGEK
jgi:hypothetical protein